MTGVLVFRTQVAERFEWVVPRRAEDFDVLHALAQRPAASTTWEPVRVDVLKVGDRHRRLKRAAMPWLAADLLVLRDEAIEAVGPLLAPHGVLLPLECDEAELVLFSAGVRESVLDEARSELVRLDSGEIFYLPRPVFHASLLAGAIAFRLAELPYGGVFLTGPLVDAIQRTGTTAGTNFELVYREPDGR